MITFMPVQRRFAMIGDYVRALFDRIAAERSGTAIIEFAFAAPVMILLVVGSIEFGMVMFTSTLMEGAIRDASRYGITGQEPTEAARLARILELVGENTLGLVDMSTARIDVLVYPAFADIGKPESFTDGNGNGAFDAGETFTDTNGNGVWDADSGAPGPGGSGDIVLYRINYDWPFITPFFASILGNETLSLTASLAVRNEPKEIQ